MKHGEKVIVLKSSLLKAFSGNSNINWKIPLQQEFDSYIHDLILDSFCNKIFSVSDFINKPHPMCTLCPIVDPEDYLMDSLSSNDHCPRCEIDVDVCEKIHSIGRRVKLD